MPEYWMVRWTARTGGLCHHFCESAEEAHAVIAHLSRAGLAGACWEL